MNVVTHDPKRPGTTTAQPCGQRERARGRARGWGRRLVARPRRKCRGGHHCRVTPIPEAWPAENDFSLHV
eukprot:12711034-Alexandrium_andersonii.AAC.1